MVYRMTTPGTPCNDSTGQHRAHDHGLSSKALCKVQRPTRATRLLGKDHLVFCCNRAGILSPTHAPNMQRLSALLWAFLTCAFLAFTAPTLGLPRGDVAAPSNGIVSRIAATELTVGEESETDKVVFSRYKGCTPLRGPRKQIDKENIVSEMKIALTGLR